MKVLLADANHPVLADTLISSGLECHPGWEKSTDELISLLPGYDALVIRSRFRLTKEILSSATRLKCIGRVGAGMENIDVDFALSMNIKCICVPEGNRDAVGEHAVGMLLMLLNNIKKADAEVRNGLWLRAENRGIELKDKTVGIIGYGNMGSAFAEKLAGFGCRILAYDKYKKGFANKLINEVSEKEIFDESDVVSVHVPLTNETTYMVNDAFIGRFRKNIVIINTARGKCLNTADLVAAIEKGKVTGACLDVLEYEKVSFEGIAGSEMPDPLKFLINSDRVILTPHIAGWTHESNYKMSKMIAEKMIEVLRIR